MLAIGATGCCSSDDDAEGEAVNPGDTGAPAAAAGGSCTSDDECLKGPQNGADAGAPAAPTPGEASGGSGGAQTPVVAAGPVGDWVYSSTSYPRDDGTMAMVGIGGELSLRADGSWVQNRRVGSVTSTGRGRFVADGSRLTMKHHDGSQELTYDYHFGTYTDVLSGETVRALTLSFTDGSGYEYILVEK